MGRDSLKLSNFLYGLILLFGGSACSEVITISRISTPVPTTNLSAQTVSAERAVFGGDGPTRLQIEVIDLDAPVVEMGWRAAESEGGEAFSVWEIPVNEAGWHLNSARPGEGSNIVISGHNDSTGGHVFGDLDNVEEGDEISVWIDDDTIFAYQIADTQIVRAFNASQDELEYLAAVIRPTDREQLTLITCWPSWTNTHRLIVIAHPL